MGKSSKSKQENRHVYGVFLCIIKKGPKNTRILILELPTGQFLTGKIPNELIHKVKLRHLISVDLKEVESFDDINKIVKQDKYNIQPSAYRDIDTDLL